MVQYFETLPTQYLNAFEFLFPLIVEAQVTRSKSRCYYFELLYAVLP